MSDTSDIKFVTLNTKTIFNTSAAIERVKLHNNSSFFLRVYYGADAPTDPNSGAGWHDTIDPGGTPLLEVVGNSAQTFSNRSFIQSTPYLGIITVMPFLPVGALAAAGGVITGAALVYLTAYYPGEWAQEGGEIEAYVQAAKQGRTQGVVGAAGDSCRILVDETNTAGAHNFIRPLGGNVLAPNLYAANAAGGSLINFYLFGYTARFVSRTPAHAGVEYFMSFAVADNIFTVTRGSIQWNERLIFSCAGFGVQEIQRVFPNPLFFPVVVPQNQLANTDTMWAVYSPQAGSTRGSFTINHFLWGVVDTVNQSPLIAIGPYAVNGLNPAWSTFNPQTY